MAQSSKNGPSWNFPAISLHTSLTTQLFKDGCRMMAQARLRPYTRYVLGPGRLLQGDLSFILCSRGATLLNIFLYRLKMRQNHLCNLICWHVYYNWRAFSSPVSAWVFPPLQPPPPGSLSSAQRHMHRWISSRFCGPMAGVLREENYSIASLCNICG